MKHTETFHLSHHDCDALSAALHAKAAEANEAHKFEIFDAYTAAARMLHDERMKAFSDRADRRRIKRQKLRDTLDTVACKDG